ncbi:hypothetical protein AB0F81_24370 [Actinoplanes sp. NPDC024001]|uniref:hypothetical protein n=1 Tax=Actinoplanes sp. NPDC024001 TaxID=3154598 RepID=UPI0033C2DD71
MIFRVRRWRLWLAIVPSLWALLFLSRVVAAALIGTFRPAEALVEVTISALAVGSGVTFFLRPLGWVRVAEAGLEFAPTGHAAMFLPWAAVQTVELRYAGPFTRLVITPTDPAAVEVTGEALRVQRARRRAGFPSYAVDVGLLEPGAKQLLAEVRRVRRTARS